MKKNQVKDKKKKKNNEKRSKNGTRLRASKYNIPKIVVVVCHQDTKKKNLRANNHFDKTVFRYHNTVVISLTVIFFLFRGCVIWISKEITLVLFRRL